MNHDDSHEARKVHSLAMAVTLAMLGVSVGVDVHKVWAESQLGGAPIGKQPTVDRSAIKFGSKEALQQKYDAIQHKLDATQQKHMPSQQFKVPSVQQKDMPVRPKVKPIDPPR